MGAVLGRLSVDSPETDLHRPDCSSSMATTSQVRSTTRVPSLKYAIELWPYLLIAISVFGFAYEFLIATR
jgi:hypothetical protein